MAASEADGQAEREGDVAEGREMITDDGRMGGGASRGAAVRQSRSKCGMPSEAEAVCRGSG
ncbi:hypothetical protein CH63R_02646 [Colletotrichum higginsianum IMI 349063]|uniref:Uncharacterized protein n=1 Tax=Colletotrichum higginsianum (strain IMI 349063) TaxID=759273 RepID=A0A1B7YPF4_COLHI|nr:hypothetical protein CH63R_02646 [Colletotrichum higginsianum IMI 349063]OBR13920.1 hypothetical protein CH63R_02646 [Colletotrichum higginsianum IMI 349063]